MTDDPKPRATFADQPAAHGLLRDQRPAGRALAELTSPQVADIDGIGVRRLVVPLGSLEQHGPHLPLATDTIIAEYVASELVASRDDLALAPAIPVGASGEHAGFSGTLSIGTDALAMLLVELVRDSSRDYGSVVLVNGHGGNAAAIGAARAICLREGRGVQVAQCHFPSGDAHAGRTETSVMLHIAPHLVGLDVAEPGVTTPVRDLMPRLRDGGIAAVSANGVLGDPTGASAAEGAQLLTDLLTRLRDTVGG